MISYVVSDRKNYGKKEIQEELYLVSWMERGKEVVGKMNGGNDDTYIVDEKIMEERER